MKHHVRENLKNREKSCLSHLSAEKAVERLSLFCEAEHEEEEKM